MKFARSREICVTVSLSLVPSLLHAAPAVGASEATVAGAPATEDAPASSADDATVAGAPSSAAAPARATGSAVDDATSGARDEAPVGAPARERPRTWQIYQRPLPGAEHSWGPPNGQMPAVVEVSEGQLDPNQPPPNGLPRIIVGAALGVVGLGVFGLGIAARTTDVLGEDRRAAVPLLGAGLVTAAVGWGLFAHGILRRKAFLRWQSGQATIAPTLGGATLLLRF